MSIFITARHFDWDIGSERKSLDKHGVDQQQAEQVFFNQPLLLLEDQSHSFREARYHALGHTDQDRLLHITFTLRFDGTHIRIISTRDMSRRELQAYARQT